MIKALNVIHDSFFLSEYQELNLFICGIGTVGGKLIEQIALQSEKLKKERASWRLFTLTTTPAFFRTIGFREVPKEEFPEKIWSDCSKCPKFNCCDETALLMTP